MSLRSAFHKRLRKRGMGVSGAGGVAKPGWATTEQPIPGGGSKKPVTPQVKPLPGMTPLGIPEKPTGKHKNMQAAVMKAVRAVGKHKDKRGSTAHHKGAAPGTPQGDPSRGKPQNLGGGWYAHTKEVGGKPYYMMENTKTGEVDYPVFYPSGGVGYDRPEAIPLNVRAKLQSLGPPEGGPSRPMRQVTGKERDERGEAWKNYMRGERRERGIDKHNEEDV